MVRAGFLADDPPMSDVAVLRRGDQWGRLRAGWASWATLGIAVVLTPVFGWLVTLETRWEQAENPPPCTGLGFGCELDPSATGWLAAAAYLFVLVVVAVVVALLHLGGRRLALTRSLLTLVVVSVIWVTTVVLTAWQGVS